MGKENNDTSLDNLSNTLIRGSTWMLSMNWLVRLLGILSTAILARLLVPEDFGLMAMVMVLAGITTAFLNFGVEFALIQKKNTKREHYDSGWTIRIIQSTAVAVIILAMTPVITSFYGEKKLELLVPLIALAIFIRGWENIGTVIIRKNLEFKKDFTFNFVKKFLSVLAVVSLAVYFRNYYALAIGIIAISVIAVILSFIISDYRPKLTMIAAGEIWSFSQWNMLKGIALYLYTEGDKLIVGRVSTAENLGFYVISTEISSLASSEIVSPIGRALIPGFSKIQDDKNRVRSGFLKSFSATLLIALPVGMGIYSVADDAIPLLLGKGWEPSIPLLKALSLFALTRILSTFAGDIIIVLGKIKFSSFLSWLELIIFFSLIYPAFLWNGVLGIAYARVLTGCFSIVFNLGYLSYLIKLSIFDYFKAMYRSLIAVIFMVIGLELTSFYLIESLGFEPGLFSLILKIFVGAIIYIFTAITLWVITGRTDGIEKKIVDMVFSKINTA